MALSDKDKAIIAACEDTDEPVFILRGKDILAATTIEHYLRLFRKHGPINPQKEDQIVERRREFERWQSANVGKVRYPD
jgi:hypothetical protein